MQYISYVDVIPGGNKTALVLGDDYDADERKRINDVIMAADKEIEQVGFVKNVFKKNDVNDASGLVIPSLQMAGGEFCGNATRSAAYYYLQGRPGTLTMTVSGGKQVACGVHETGDAWCEIPLLTAEAAPRTEAAADPAEQAAAANPAEQVTEANPAEQVTVLVPGISKVSLSGITHLVLEPEAALPYLRDPSDLKAKGLSLIEKYGLKELEAAGAIFLERLADGRLKINPIVWVRDIQSLFYETACGSGTVATAMVLAKAASTMVLVRKAPTLQEKEASKAAGASSGRFSESKQSFSLLQPSGMTIRAEITLAEDCKAVTRAFISGPVKTDLATRTLSL